MRVESYTAYAYTGLITVSILKEGNITHLMALQPSVKLEMTHTEDSSTHQLAVTHNT